MPLKDEFWGTDKYLLDPELADAVAIARTLGLPLLLEGEPGTGKTRLAEAIATAMKTRLYEFPVTSESKIEQLVVDFDSIQRLTDAQATILNVQLQQAGLDQRLDLGGRSVDQLRDYVKLGPLARAYQDPGSVLLIDEIDKGKREFSNSLLYVFSEKRIVIPYTGEVVEAPVENMPVIVITSNREQALPSAFLRRCIYHFIAFPTPERLRAIVRLHFPAADDQLVAAAVSIFYQLRELKLDKKPATAEMLNWFAYLQAKGIAPAELDRLPGSQTLIKSHADLGILRDIQQNGVASLLRPKSSRGVN
ncbi:MAG TPA: MoxR family ATPase [Terriglobia bacterium]|nr:MoxR family ATPase [Terriglobia bacterium]